MSFTPGSKHGQMAEINMTPMIDVMLVLLIVFMVAAPMLTTGVDVNLPSSKTGKSLQSEALSISMDSQGRIEFDRKVMALGALQKALRTQASQNKGRPVLVRADNALAYGRVIEVVDVIREAGFTQVGFVTQGVPPVREDARP